VVKRSILRIAIGTLITFSFLVTMSALVHAERDTTYRVISLYDLTGPYAGLHQLNSRGEVDFWRWANNEPGYLPEGVKIKDEIYDHGMDMGRAVAAYHMAVSSTPRPILTTGGQTSPTILAIKSIAKREKIPCVDGASARSIMVPPAWTFSMQGCYEGMVAAAGRLLRDNWRSDTPYTLIRKRYEENKNRNPRMSIIGWDNAFGRGFDQKEGRDYLKSIGVDWVESEYVPLNPTDTTPQILRLVKGGVDMIFFGLFAESHAFILKDAARMGVREKFQDMCFWADNIIQLKNYAGKLAEGTLMITGYQMTFEEWPEWLLKNLERSGLGENGALSYSGVASWFDVDCEAIRRAAKKVGPENITGQDIYDALISMKDYQCMAYNSKITFNETRRIGPSTAAVYQIQNGKVVKVEKSVYIPDLLPNGKDVVR